MNIGSFASQIQALLPAFERFERRQALGIKPAHPPCNCSRCVTIMATIVKIAEFFDGLSEEERQRLGLHARQKPMRVEPLPFVGDFVGDLEAFDLEDTLADLGIDIIPMTPDELGAVRATDRDEQILAVMDAFSRKQRPHRVRRKPLVPHRKRAAKAPKPSTH
jgi:hypothetical protein